MNLRNHEIHEVSKPNVVIFFKNRFIFIYSFFFGLTFCQKMKDKVTFDFNEHARHKKY
jgi:hypothetical protein